MKRFVTAAGVALAMLVVGCTSSVPESGTATSGASFTTVDISTPAPSSSAVREESTAAELTIADDPATADAAASGGSGTSGGAQTSGVNPTGINPTGASEPTGQGESTGAGESTGVVQPTAPAGPAVYAPPVDPEAVPGACPYLTVTEVAQDTGQRTGAASIRPGAPFPVCEFVRTDGGYLATVRVLQFATDVEATAAVDYYLPRDTSEPAAKPDGWNGGLMVVGADESRYGVSKGTTAVIGITNLDTTVSARELVKHAIANLGL